MDDDEKLFRIEVVLSGRQESHIGFCNFQHGSILDCSTCKRIWKYPKYLAYWRESEKYER